MSAATALATIPVQESRDIDAYRPRDINQAFALAKWFSESGLLGDLNTPEKVLLVMMTGAELEVPATAALRGIHIIKGKPRVSSALKVALCQRRKDRCEYFHLVESTDEKATYVTKPVGGKPVTMTFTLDDAERAQVSFKPDSNWSKYPRAMLRARAASELADAVYQDLVQGIQTVEDFDEEPARTNGPVVMQPIGTKAAQPRPVEQAKPVEVIDVQAAETKPEPATPAAAQPATAAPAATAPVAKPAAAAPAAPAPTSWAVDVAQIEAWRKVFAESWDADEVKETAAAISAAEGVSKNDRKILIDAWRAATKRIEKAEKPPEERVPGSDDE